MPALIPNAHVISAAGLPGADVAHFTSASYRTLGERYAQKMMKLVYNICDSTSIESWFQIDGGSLIKSDTIDVNQNAVLKLVPEPSAEGSWSWAGAGTSGTSREQTVNTASAGTYTALATFSNACGTQSHLSVIITVKPFTGIKWNKTENNSVKIYPNPASNIITIEGYPRSGSQTIRNGIIANMYGQTVLTFCFGASTSDNLVDISVLDTGTYYLKLLGDRGIIVNKFVKLK